MAKVLIRSFITLCLIPIVLHAYFIRYNSSTFDQKGPGIRQHITIVNDKETPVGLKASMVEVSFTKDGTENQTPVESDFYIHPQKLIVPPNNQAQVNLIWKGPALAQEKMYRILIHEVNLELDTSFLEQKNKTTKESGKASAAIKILQNYEKAFFVTVPGSSYKIDVNHAFYKQVDGKDKLVVVLENKGNKHVRLSHPAFFVRSKRDNVEVKYIPQISRSTRLLPGDVRELVVDWPVEVPKGPVNVGVSFKHEG